MSNSFRSTFSKSQSTSSPYKTYDEYQTTRREKLDQLNSDIEAKNGKDVQELQDTLKLLMFQLNAAHERLALDERDFLRKKENLSTELKQVQIDAEIKYSNAQIEYIENVDRFTEAFNLSLQEYIQSLPDLMEPSRSLEILSKPKNSSSSSSPRSSKYIKSYITNYDDEDDDAQLYNERIQELEEQKRELLHTIKEEERNNQGKLEEISMMIDNQESAFDQEINKLQTTIKGKEEQYDQQLTKLYSELQKAIDKRIATAEKRQQKVAALQAQIDRLEGETREKLREANLKAEKLKASLRNINLQKSKQLEYDQRISAQTRELNEESLNLQQQMFSMQRELQKTKAESQVRRRELSQQIGARKVASLFP